MNDPFVVNAFLHRFLEDRETGREHDLSHYQSFYPGHEQAIAELYARFHRPPGIHGAGADGEVGRTVGPYRLIRELGRGGQGVVYLAEHARLQRPVALKVLSGLRMLGGDELGRFLREAEVASRLDHPGISTVYDTGMEAGQAWIALRYVEGETLAHRIAAVRGNGVESSHVTLAGPREQGPTGLWRLVQFFEMAARALHYAHEAGVIHRDIKPGNIMVTKEGHPVLLDFGLARDAGPDRPNLTRTGDLFGTPSYMSPEQIAGQRLGVDRRSDVNSLGVALYESLTLERPFEAPTREGLYHAILSQPPADPRSRNAALPRDLRVILETALEKDRDRRYQTAEAFAEDLRRIRTSEPIAARPVSRWNRLVRWSRREPAQAALLLVLLIALPTFTALVTRHLMDRPKVEAQRLRALEADKEELLSLGSIDLGEGDIDQALARFEKALAMEGRSLEAAAGIVLTHLEGDRPEKALQVLDREAGLLGGRYAAVLLRADALRALGRPDEAERMERAAPPAQDAVDFYLMGQRFLARGAKRHEAAARAALRASTQAILLASTPRALYHFQRLHAAGHIRDTRAVQETAQAVLTRWPESAVAHYLVGFGLARCGATEAAMDRYHEALRLRPDYPEAHINLGNAFHDQGRLDEAIHEYRAALRGRPEYAEAHHNLANCLGKTGHLEDAIAAHREAIRIRPDYSGAHNNLGSLLCAQGRFAEALIVHGQAVRLDAGSAEAHTNLGATLLKNGFVGEAIVFHREAIRLRPGYPAAYNNLGVALDRQGLRDEALAAWREAVRLKPDYGGAYRNLSFTLLEQGRFDEAIAAQREAVCQEPQGATAHYYLGNALRRKGLFDEATISFREALRLKPDYAEVHCDLGLTQRQQGLFREALVSLKKGHALGSRRSDWKHPSADWIAKSERLAVVEDRVLDAVEKGTLLGLQEDPKEVCLVLRAREKHLLRARWLAARLESEPAHRANPDTGLRLEVARAAALTGSGRGEGASALSEEEKAVWRRRALGWLEGELAAWRGRLEQGQATNQTVLRTLDGWFQDPDLAAVREEAALALLPDEETETLRAFWAKVRGLRRTLGDD